MTEHPPGAASSSGPRSSFDRVLNAAERLGLSTKNQRAHEAMVQCPAHDESNPSMHVTWQAGDGRGGGRVLLYCHGCQAPAVQLAEALNLQLTDLFDEPAPRRDNAVGRVSRSAVRRKAGKRRGRLGRLPDRISIQPRPPKDECEHRYEDVETYRYENLRGELVQVVQRQECTYTGAKHKNFPQQFVSSISGRLVSSKPKGFFPVLYRASAVRDAVEAGQPVWLVEGEKDVHTAEELGLVATTNPGGGANFPDELVDCLTDATVMVVLDRDDTGWARGVTLHQKLTAAGATVRLRLPAVEDRKADFTDHVEAGQAVEDLVSVDIEEVKTWHEMKAVDDRLKRLQIAGDEALAQLERADGGHADEHRQHARRWAMEAQIRHEDLQAAVDRVHVHGMRMGTEWVGEAMVAADEHLATGTEIARKAHEAAQVAMPPSLQLVPVQDDQPPVQEPPEDSPRLDEDPSRDAGDPTGALQGAPGPAEPPQQERSTPAGRTRAGGVAGEVTFTTEFGRIWQISPKRGRKAGDEDATDVKQILSMVVWVTAREYLEVEAAEEGEHLELMGRSAPEQPKPAAPRQLLAVRVAYQDEVSGETMEMRVRADDWRDHSWLEALPGPPDYDHRRAGLDILQRAILAISSEVRDEVLFRSPGWREDPEGGHRYVHARGVITARGHEPAQVGLSGPLVRYDLPDPVRDATQLREAFWGCSAVMLDRVPDVVTAPLLGQVFRAVLGHNPWVVALIGSPGSYKTSLAAKAMHHFGERWDHSKPASSMSGNGDTLNALRLKLHLAKDTLYWADDFAPTKSWLEAQKHLEESARLIHNQEDRDRNSRDGLEINPGKGARASGLFTSEVMPRPGSASERMFVVPLRADDVDKNLLFPLDEPESRHGRALVMSSYIQWLADDLVERRRRYLAIADEYADHLTKTGETVRQSAAIGNVWCGWVAMADFLLDAGAITDEERCSLLTRVDTALRDAAQAAVDPDMPRTTGARVRELLGYALQQGIAYVDDVRSGDCPPWPLAGQLGWRRQSTETDSNGLPTRVKIEARGMRLGYVMHDPGPRHRGRVLMLESTQLEAVLKAASATQTEQLQIDRLTAMKALYEEGVLIPDTSEAKRTFRWGTKCYLDCEGRYKRMLTLLLDPVVGDEADGEDDGDSEPPPAAPPGLGGHSGDGGAGPAGPGAGSDPEGAGAGPQTPASNDAAGPQKVDAPPQEDLASATNEEDGMVAKPPPPTPTTWADAEGVEGTTVPGDHGTAPCLLCGGDCTMLVDQQRIHLACWVSSTRAQRDNATPEGPPVAAPGTTGPGDSNSAPGPRAADPGPAQPQNAPQQPQVPSRPPTPSRVGVAEAFTASAAIITAGGAVCSDQQTRPLPFTPRHAGDLHRLAAELGLGTQIRTWKNKQQERSFDAPGQIWVDDQIAAGMGIDVDAIRGADKPDEAAREVTAKSQAVTAAVEAGFEVGPQNREPALGRWTRVRAPHSQESVWVVLMAALPEDPDEIDRGFPLLSGHPEPAQLARRVGLYSDALGFPYTLSTSTTGLDLLQALRWRERDSLLAAHDPVEPAARQNVERELNWSRKPTSEELEHTWLHAYDRGGSYLAGMSRLDLGFGDPTHHPDGTAFQRVPGYWFIKVPESGDWRMPHPIDPAGRYVGKYLWVTTPTLEFAREQGYEPEVVEAYTWSNHRAVFDGWYERFRDARTALDLDDVDAQLARDQLKATYAHTVGMLGSHTHMAGRIGYAPDWRHHIIAKARVNVARRIATIGKDTGRWPVAVEKDTVLYTSNEEDPAKAWPGGPKWFGRGLGQYKHEGSVLLADHLQFLTGDRYPHDAKAEIVGSLRAGSE